MSKNNLTKKPNVYSKDEQKQFDQETKRLLKSAKRNPFLWKQYYKHSEQFANIRNCFALTVHNSQGSTFLEAGIDGKDLSKRLYPERGDDSKAVQAKIREFNRLSPIYLINRGSVPCNFHKSNKLMSI